MSRRYDSRTTIFSPEGRLYQTEYAIEAISHAGTCLGILANDGVVLAAEKMVASKLLDDAGVPEKLYKVGNHLGVAVAGLDSDANLLVKQARLAVQRHLYNFGGPMPVEQLVVRLSDFKQSYTQHGGLRPFGAAFLYAGYDEHHGFQLYHSDPAGNYWGWKATCIGKSSTNAQSILKQEYKDEGMSLKEALSLAVKVLSKTMEGSELNSEKVEFATLTLANTTKAPKFSIYSNKQVDELLKAEGVVETAKEAP